MCAAAAYRDSELKVLRVVTLRLVQLLHHMGSQPPRLVVCHLLMYGFTLHRTQCSAPSLRIFYSAALDTLIIFISKPAGAQDIFCGIQ